jgi:hypothetical protein
MKKIRYMKKTFIYLLVGFCFLFASSFILSQELDGQESPGELSKVHEGLRGEKNCIKCHSAKKEIDPSKCLGCHKELALRISAGKGFHKEKGEECAACHQEHNGETVQLIQWDIEEFDHSETGYLLTGSHRKVTDCEKCHTSANAPPRKYSKTFFLKDNRCSACHNDIHNGYHPNCIDCHTTKDWRVDIW